MNNLPHLLDTQEPQQWATGYTFTEGPLWDPQGFFYFADVRGDALHRIVPGQQAEFVRKTQNGNGTAFDLKGRIIQCEGLGRRLTAWDPKTGVEETFVDRADGKRLNRPNDVVCRSDGSILFSDPDKRIPVEDRELDAGIWRVAPDGTVSLLANCEYPNGFAFSPDERKLYVANTRFLKYLHELTLDEKGEVVSRRLFADMSQDLSPGSPDGVKVDVEGRVFATGPGGILVFDPSGQHLGTIQCPQAAVNFTFGGHDMKTLFVCAQNSVYALRVKVPGLTHPWQRSFAR